MKWKVADTERNRPPVSPDGFGLGFRAADSIRYGIVALIVLKVPMVSISMTVLKALGLSPDMGAMKLPAAPALMTTMSENTMPRDAKGVGGSYTTKSIAPSSLTHLSAAAFRLSN